MKKIITVWTLFIAFGCSDEIVNQNVNDSIPSYPVLTFKGSEDMTSYVLATFVNGLDSQNRQAAAPGFKSLEDLYKEALDEVSKANSSAQINSIMKTYGDVIELADSSFLPKIQNQFYRTICNRDRIYVSDGLAHKVLNNEIILVTDKAYIDALRNIECLDNLNRTVFQVIKYNNQSQISGNVSGRSLSDVCSNNMEYSYYYDPSGCKDDRKVYVRAYIYWVVSGSNYTPWLISETWGRRRAGTLCYWYSYNTLLNFRDAYFDVKIVINGMTNHYILTESDIPDYYGTVEEGSHIIWNNALTGAITWQGGTPPAISFTRAFVEASSRGTNNNWVSIDCIGI